MNKISVIKIQKEELLQAAFQIRREVFVVEQEVSAEEEYEFEEDSVHFLATINYEPAGTARWRITEKGVKLERFAVLNKFRGMGVGSSLLDAVIADIPLEFDYLYLHAQITAMGLYSKFNFKAVGEEFIEANIRHYKMELKR